MNVKGSNEIILNSATVQLAVQEYLAKRWLVSCPKVMGVEYKKTTYDEQFIFTVEGVEPKTDQPAPN